MALACISVDLDSIPHYCRIHGLREEDLPAEALHVVYRTAVDRFLELFAKTSVRATFFAVGADLDDPASSASLRTAAEAGHEIASHSHAHDYGLALRPAQEIAEDLARAEKAISAAVGTAPRGFRAPGYTLTAELYTSLCERGYLYDSSVFPSAPYYLAKAAVMGLLSLRRRPSQAILDRARVVSAPRLPYRPDAKEPYRKGRGETLELPITVSPLGGVPFIGFAVLAPPRAAVAALYRTLRKERFLNLELHGIDILDDDDVGLPSLSRAQRDLRIPRSLKRERLLQVLRWVGTDFEVVTLAEAAKRLRGERSL
jgi:peptidoglycan/xylan/chitin deacetylase (PgdA/CDA1 family)